MDVLSSVTKNWNMQLSCDDLKRELDACHGKSGDVYSGKQKILCHSLWTEVVQICALKRQHVLSGRISQKIRKINRCERTNDENIASSAKEVYYLFLRHFHFF